MLNHDINHRLNKIIEVCQLLSESDLSLGDDSQTEKFCRDFLRVISISDLQKKINNELGHLTYKPLGKILFVISENDILGTTFSFLAAYLTENKMVIKARKSQDLLYFLKNALDLSDDDVTIIDFQGGTQNDEILLQDINAVVLAGSDALIEHYRKITPFPKRLIEFGPKLSTIAIGQEILVNVQEIAKLITFDTTLFLQKVCSSPKFIAVESLQMAEGIFEELSKDMKDLSCLDNETRLAQKSRLETLKALKIFQPHLSNIAYSEKTGWGIVLTTKFDPNLWFDYGFNIIVGNIEHILQQANNLWQDRLQTLGAIGVDTQKISYFHRICPLGKMHQRPSVSPHDGIFELSALVSFMSKEI